MKKPTSKFKGMKPFPGAGSKPIQSAMIGGVGNAPTVKSSKKGK